MINGYRGRVDIRPDIRARFNRIRESAIQKEAQRLREATTPDPGAHKWGTTEHNRQKRFKQQPPPMYTPPKVRRSAVEKMLDEMGEVLENQESPMI